MVKIQRLFAKTNLKIPVCRIQKFNMKCEIERMEINYAFYFLPIFEKSDKKTIDILLLEILPQ